MYGGHTEAAKCARAIRQTLERCFGYPSTCQLVRKFKVRSHDHWLASEVTIEWCGKPMDEEVLGVIGKYQKPEECNQESYRSDIPQVSFIRCFRYE